MTQTHDPSSELESTSVVASTSVEVDVFGSTILRVGGEPVSIERRQVRSLLSALAGRAGHGASVDALIEHLWPTDLPANPRKALSVAASRLRRALGPAGDRLVSTGSTYAFTADRVDIDEFARTVDGCRDLRGADACAQLGAALEAWAGDPFADEIDSELVNGRRQSLEEMRWYAITRRCELLHELAQPDQAVVESAPFVERTDDVVRERLVVAHARALGASGRRTEALDVVARAIARLRDELGLDPSPALLAAQYELLAGAVDVVPSASVRPDADAAFVGRERELDVLDAVEPGRAITVIGEAGMGKSALLVHHVHRLRAAGRPATLIEVSTTPDRPLDAVARLCLDLATTSLAEPRSEFHPALARICPELGLEPGGVSLTRDAMVDDLVRFIESAGGAHTFVVDDAHWLDGGSIEIMDGLVASGRVSLIFGMRPTDDPRLGVLCGRFAGEADDTTGTAVTADDSPCRPVPLTPLESRDLEQLVAALLGRGAAPDVIEALRERSGGNSLFLRLLVDQWIDGDRVGDEFPSSILVAVSERLDVLSRRARETLDIVAVAGDECTLHPIRTLRPNADVELAEAADAGLIDVDSADDVVAFVHALVADVCRELLPDGRRVAVHDELGRILEFDGAAAAEYARHYVASASLDPVRAVWSSVHAAAEFIVGLDWQSAAEHIDAARSIADHQQIADPELLAHIAVRQGIIARALGRDGYVDGLFSAVDLAREADQTRLFVVAVTELCGHGLTTSTGAPDPRVLDLLDEALAFDLAPVQRAELCAAATPLFAATEAAMRGRRLFREAWELAAELDDPEVEAAVAMGAHLGFAHPDDFELLAHAGGRLDALAGSDPEMQWEAAFIGFECAVVRGNPVGARDALEVMRRCTPDISRRPRDFGLAFSESAFACLAGDLESAEHHADEAFAIGVERYDASWATTLYGLLLISIRAEQGRLGELGDAIGGLVAERPDYVALRSVASLVALAAGDEDTARGHLDVLAAHGFDRVVPDLHYTSVLTLAAPATAELGTAEEGRALTDRLRPFAGRMSWNGAGSNGPVDASLALLARSAGDDAAGDRFQASADELAGRFRSAAGTSVVGSSASQTATS